VFGPRDISRIEREFLDVLDYQLRVTEADLLTLERPFLSAFFSPKPRVSYATPSSSLSSSNHLREDDGEEEEEEEDSSSRWSDSDEEDEATTDFTSSPSGSDRSISPKTPSAALGSFPIPPASDPALNTTKLVGPQPTRHPTLRTFSQIYVPLSV
jgi:hypothetical protein